MLCAVPTEELFGLSDVIKFKLNTSGVTDDDVISARLGVYVRKLRSSTPRRQYVSSPRPNRLSQMVRVQISDVTWLHRVQALRRRTVYNVGYDGQWIMFEASLRILVTTRKCGLVNGISVPCVVSLLALTFESIGSETQFLPRERMRARSWES